MLGDQLSGRPRVDPLYESEVRFRRLAALSADVYWEQDEALRFISFSTSRSSHLGRSVTERLIGKTRWEVPYLNMTAAEWAAHRAVLQAASRSATSSCAATTSAGTRCGSAGAASLYSTRRGPSRATRASLNLPVLLFSGHIDEELRRRARELGVRELLGQLDAADELIHAIDRLAAAERGPRPAP